MRQVHRLALSKRAQAYLDGKAALTAGQASVESEWKIARQTKTLGAVVATLRSMLGPRERCMYCVDSHGSDIEHFWPKAHYPARAFLWPNMLLCCTECGRLKGDRFPLSDTGAPMLIDPSAENPWDCLDFDPDTGNVTARYDVTSGAPVPKGEVTVNLLRLSRRESMAEGYRRTHRRIVVCIKNFLAGGATSPQQLAQDVRQADDHGLLGWCFGPVGARLTPFAELRSKAPQAWAACEAAARADVAQCAEES